MFDRKYHLVVALTSMGPTADGTSIFFNLRYYQIISGIYTYTYLGCLSLAIGSRTSPTPCCPLQENEDPAPVGRFPALKRAGAGAAEGRLISSRPPLQQVAPEQHNSRLPPLPPRADTGEGPSVRRHRSQQPTAAAQSGHR